MRSGRLRLAMTVPSVATSRAAATVVGFTGGVCEAA